MRKQFNSDERLPLKSRKKLVLWWVGGYATVLVAVLALVFKEAERDIAVMSVLLVLVVLVLGMAELLELIDSPQRSRTNERRRSKPFKALFTSFSSICIRNPETKALIAEILHAHDEQLRLHPRTKSWRIWIHGCTVVALIWYLLIKQFQCWPLRWFDQLIGVAKKFRLR